MLELRFHAGVCAFTGMDHLRFGCGSHASLTFMGSMSRCWSQWSWWSDRAQWGGVLGAIGSHYVNLLTHLTHTRVRRVQCTLRTVIDRKQDPDAAEGAMKAVISDTLRSQV